MNVVGRPEYITATNTTAYITLQENNAIAALDLTREAFVHGDPGGVVVVGARLDVEASPERYRVRLLLPAVPAA